MKTILQQLRPAIAAGAAVVGAQKADEYIKKTREEHLEKAKAAYSSLFSSLEANHPLSSVSEFLKHHERASKDLADLKTYLTADQKTIASAQEIIAQYCAANSFTSEYNAYLENLVFGAKKDLAYEKASKPVQIELISDYAEYEELHQKYLATKQKDTMIAVGGPAAEDQTLLSSLIPSLAENLNSLFISAGYTETNQSNSAAQVHARHGNALNADSTLTGHALLSTLIKRGLVKSVIGGEAELADAIENASYRKIHIKFTLDPEKLEIYLGNEINWLRQKFRKYFTGLDQHDLNRLESVTSAEIMRNIESQLQEIMGTEFKILVGNERSNPRSSSIHTALTEDEVDETRVENSHLADIDIESHELSRDEIKELFGDNANILAAFSYPGDGHIPMEYHAQVREAVTKLGQQWMEPSEVKKIFLYNKDGKLALAGALIEEGGERNFIPADKMHFTGGYMSELFYGSEIDGVKVLSNPTTVATGVSINAILKRTPEINKFIKEFGSTGQIAVTNSHWTLLAKGDDEVIIRITGGGNTGSEEYNPNYFLNVIANTNKIFQDALIGVIRSYGCPRSINSINSTQFEKIAEGLLVSYGKGGTGNTKRFAEAVIGLDALGYGEEVAEYFSQFKNYAGENMGAVIKDMCKTFKKESAFFIDSTRKTKEALMPFGYSSFLENFSSRFAASAFTEHGQDAPTQFPSKLISHSPEKARAKALQERQREGASK